MEIEIMKYYGMKKEFSKADYFETENYQNMFTNRSVLICKNSMVYQSIALSILLNIAESLMST